MTTPVPEPVEGHRATPLALVLLAVFVAGVLGTAARLGIDAVMPAQPGGITVSTLLINTVGSFVLGVLLAAIPRHSPEWLRAGATTGLLGSFTTFSALTVAAVELTGSGAILPAAAMLLLSVAAGVGAAVLGIAVGAALTRTRV